MSIDQRLRAGLHRSAEAIQPDVPAALASVRVLSRRRRRAVMLARIAVATVVVAVALVLTPRLLDRREGHTVPVAQSPAGTYAVTVSDGAAARAGGLVGRWLITLGPDGTVAMHPPAGYTDVPGAAYRVEGDRFRTDAFLGSPGCQASAQLTGTYRWVRTPAGLDFTVVADTCDARRVLFGDPIWEVSR